MKCTMSITDPIQHYGIKVFSISAAKAQTHKKHQMKDLKNYCNLFSKLYISCQTREGNLNKFFEHENQP